MKTKYRIMNSMEELLTRYSYDEITINMITEQVPIARQGFYHFYENKEDLCRKIYLYFTDSGDVISDRFTLRDFISHDLSKMNRHMNFFRKLASRHYGEDLFEILFQNVYNLYSRMLKYHLQNKIDKNLENMLKLYCYGGLIFLINYLKTGQPINVEEQTTLYIDTMPQRIRDLLTDGSYPAEILKE